MILQKKIPFIRFIFYFGMALMIAAIPLSRYFMSVAQFVLTGFFLLEGMNMSTVTGKFREKSSPTSFLMLLPEFLKEMFLNMIRKFGLFFRHRQALLFSSIMLMFVIGLTYTTDFHYALKDLRTKLPLFLLPLFISTSQGVNKKEFRTLMLIYIAAVTVGSLYSTYLWFSQPITDTRDLSPFISHIRLSLNVCLAFFTLWYFIYYVDHKPVLRKIPFIILLVWIGAFLFILRTRTGIMAFFITLPFLFFLYVLKLRQQSVKYAFLSAGLILPLALVTYFGIETGRYLHIQPIDLKKLDQFTPRGNPYTFDTTLGIEDGHYVGVYLCIPELRESWNQRSTIKFDSTDRKGQMIRYTLIRYLASRGYRKDADGVKKLTDKEIRFIEDGIANINYLKRWHPKTLVSESVMAWQAYKKNKSVVGYSSLERLELWKTAVRLIRKHPLIGVGTGDLKVSFKNELTLMDSPLQTAKEGLFSSHNQFLNILVLFGVAGLGWFLFAIIYPAVRTEGFQDYFFLIFLILSLVSMLTDDTLKSQDGVTFFAFFYSFFLFGRNDKVAI
jgi:hypothetical protein